MTIMKSLPCVNDLFEEETHKQRNVLGKFYFHPRKVRYQFLEYSLLYRLTGFFNGYKALHWKCTESY